MRVLFIHPNFPAQFVNIASVLGKDTKNEVIFLTARQEGSLPGVNKAIYTKFRESAKQTHHYIRSLEDAVLQGQAAYRTLAMLKKQGFVPDVIYGHSGWGPTLYTKDVFPNTPLICYFEWFYRSLGSDCGFDPNESLTVDEECRIRTKNAPILIDLYSCTQGVSPTYYQHSQFPGEYWNKIKVIHDGVKTDYYYPQKGAKLILPHINLDLSEVDELVTYVGRGMEPYRGFPQFMESIEILLKRRPKCHVVIVGADQVAYGRPLPGSKTYKQLMLEQLNLDINRVHFTGLLPYNLYRRVLQASSAHVYLTRPFVLSWSMLEAMSTGCLVVASNTAPVKEVIQDGLNGLLVDFFAPQQIANRVEEALDNSSFINNIKVRARETVLERYDLKKLLPKQMSFLQDTIKKSSEPCFFIKEDILCQPLVSVITVCSNDGKYIRHTIDSVVASTYDNIEHIIVDDASTGDTLKILNSLKNKYKFTLIKLETNQGPSTARNIAISHSQGKYILPLDCDNYFSSDYIETLVTCAEALGAEYSPFYTQVSCSGDKQQEFIKTKWSREQLLQGPFINTGSLFSRQAFDTVGGFDSNLRQWEDYEFFLSMALHGFKGKLVEGPGVLYNLREDPLSDHFNLTVRSFKKKKAVQYIFQKHAEKLSREVWGKHTEVTRPLVDHIKIEELLKLLPPDAKVIIDFGYVNEDLVKRYKEINPQCDYIGIMPNPTVANNEKNDIDSLGLQEGTVDCLLYRNFLEQLNDPLTIIKKHVPSLKDDGQVIASIQTVQENQAHLRFSTIDSIQEIFTQVGLHIFDIQPRVHISAQSKLLQENPCPIIAEKELNVKYLVGQQDVVEYFIRATKVPVSQWLSIKSLLGEKKVCSRVRITEPNSFLTTIPGVRTEEMTKVSDFNMSCTIEDKVFIWQRAWPNSVEQQRELIRQGYLVISEIDDDPLRWREYHESNNFFVFSACHGIQTSTSTLADYLRQLNPNVAVFPNQLALLPLPRIYGSNWPVTIVFGALNREQDWKPIMPALNNILTTYQNGVKVKVIHDRAFFDALQTDSKEFTSFCSYDKYQDILYAGDIGLLPLNETRFNSMKSDLKFLECAGHGVAVLASHTVYDQSVQDGYNGVIYKNVAEFDLKLRMLIDNPEFRQSLATNAYDWVRNNRMLYQHYRSRWEWYKMLLDRLPQLNTELFLRVPELKVLSI